MTAARTTGSTEHGSRRHGDCGADVRRGAGFDVVDAITALFADAVERIPTAFDPVLCYDDFSPENVLFDGDEVTGVIDFDRAYAGHDGRDVVKAVNTSWMHDPVTEWSVREPFYRVESLVAPVAGMLALGAGLRVGGRVLRRPTR